MNVLGPPKANIKLTKYNIHIMSPTEPSTNPVIAKPGESSFLIPIPPHIIPTTEVVNGTNHKITNGVGRNEIKEVATPIIPKIKATIPSALPIFISPLISFFDSLITNLWCKL